MMALELVRCIALGKTLSQMKSDKGLLPVSVARDLQKEVGSGAASNSEGALGRLHTLGNFLSPPKP